MVLEYCECGSLFSLVCEEMVQQRKGVYTKLEALGWMLDLAHALQYLHHRDDIIIHRDIKMENVLLQRDPETGCIVAKLADFGLHKAVELCESKLLRVRTGVSSNLSLDGRSSGTHLASPLPPRHRLSECADSYGGVPAASTHGDSEVDGTTPRGFSSDTFVAIPNGAHKALLQVASRRNLLSRPAQRAFLRATTTLGVALSMEVASDGVLRRRLPAGCSPASSCDRVPRAASTPQYRLELDSRFDSRSGVPICHSGDLHLQQAHNRTSSQASFSGQLQLRLQHQASASLRDGQTKCDTPAVSFSAKVYRSPLYAGVSCQPVSDSAQTVDMPRGSQENGAVSVAAAAAAAAVAVDAGATPGQQQLVALQPAAREGVSIAVIASRSSEDDEEVLRASGGYGGAPTPTMAAFLDATGVQFQHDWQHVFSLTGHTGSLMYMAPEVFTQLPYNETADVFSFGVILYEVLTRALLRFTLLGVRDSEPCLRTADDYAAAVARGFRPRRPHTMGHPMWDLIEACWNKDPCARPTSSDMVSALEAELEVARGEPSSGGCRCVIA